MSFWRLWSCICFQVHRSCSQNSDQCGGHRTEVPIALLFVGPRLFSALGGAHIPGLVASFLHLQSHPNRLSVSHALNLSDFFFCSIAFPPAREFSLLLRVHMMKTRLLSTLQGNLSILRTMTLITSAKSLLRCTYVCV